MPVDAELPRQLSRFGLVGIAASLANLAIYHAGVVAGHMAPNLAWSAGFLVALGLAYLLHDRWSFAGRTARATAPVTGGRFLVVSLAGFALNSLWVWLLVTRGGWPVWAPYPLVLGLTPLLAFWLNRTWVFT